MLLSVLPLNINPARIGFLKFILEGYDGLGFVTTIDPIAGLVNIIYPAEQENDLLVLIEHISPSLSKKTSIA